MLLVALLVTLPVAVQCLNLLSPVSIEGKRDVRCGRRGLSRGLAVHGSGSSGTADHHPEAAHGLSLLDAGSDCAAHSGRAADSRSANRFLPDDVDVARLQAAARPQGHVGARARLRRVLSESLGATKPKPLKIAVLGSSMTAGHGLYMESHSWPQRLHKLLQEHFGEESTTLVDLSYGSANSASIFAALSAEMVSHLKNADLILVDLAISDVPVFPWGDTNIEFPIRRLAKVLMSLPQKPAVVYVETLPWHDLNGCCTSEPTCGPKCFWRPFNQLPHWPTLRDLQIPAVHFVQAVNGTEQFPQWNLHTEMHAHPGEVTHAIIAHTIYKGLLLPEFAEACSRGLAGATDFAEAALLPPQELNCYLEPSTSFVAGQVHDINGELQATNVSFPAWVEPSRAWSYSEDRPGKHGWISNKGEPGVISFPVTVRRGTVELGFLASYDNVGSVNCWVESAAGVRAPGECRIDALWNERLSLIDTVSLENVPPGDNRIRCASTGDKFKFVAVHAC